MLAVRFAPHKRRTTADGLVLGGSWVGARLRDLVESHTQPRNPAIRLEPRRAVRPSPCGGWFVIMPIVDAAKEIFRARHATGMGRLNINRRAE
jgi:hypothetical protein